MRKFVTDVNNYAIVQWKYSCIENKWIANILLYTEYSLQKDWIS